MNQLKIIIADKREELIHINNNDIDLMQLKLNNIDSCISLSKIINENNGPHFITEFKRKSPSKGWINELAEVKKITKGYEKNGASALSILTNEKYFGGNNNDIKAAREIIGIPILRKEFIVHPYQVYETKLLGADIVLLIAAGLTKKECYELSLLAHELKLEILLEIHEESELAYLNEFISFVGVNNRNLKTMEVNIENSIHLVNKIPNEFIKISESGLSDINTVKHLYQMGYQAFLMGEAFMKNDEPCVAFETFKNQM